MPVHSRSRSRDLRLVDVQLALSSSGVDLAEYVIERLGISVVMMSVEYHLTFHAPFILNPIPLSNLFATIDQ